MLPGSSWFCGGAGLFPTSSSCSGPSGLVKTQSALVLPLQAGEQADFYTQPAPRPWEIAATPPEPFSEHTEEIRVPYTSSVQVSGPCRCDELLAQPPVRVSVSKRLHSGGSQCLCPSCVDQAWDELCLQDCSRCHATGTVDCEQCNGSGYDVRICLGIHAHRWRLCLFRTSSPPCVCVCVCRRSVGSVTDPEPVTTRAAVAAMAKATRG